MSRVFARNGSWYADFTDERGARVRRQLTDVTSKRLAETYLAELVAQAARRKLGLEPAASRTQWTVWELVEWWLKERCPAASRVNERWRLEKHVKSSLVAKTLAAHAQSGQFEQLFFELAHASPKPLAAGTINHVRSKLRTAFERARREGKFAGVNPLADTQLRKVPRRIYETLSADEVPLVLREVPSQWRGFIAAAVYLGLRKGEIARLRKSDADRGLRVIRVTGSYDRDTTKGGHGDLLPIPEPMLPYLDEAMKTPGPLLFGDAKGRMRSKESDPHLTLRRAVRDAGLIVSWTLSCRRCKADGKARPYSINVEKLPSTIPVCPDCGRQRLWVKAHPRPMRFHDLRHSTATILLRARVDTYRVMRLMRHNDVSTTTGTYAHLIVEDLREAEHAFMRGEPTKLNRLLAALKVLRSEIREAAEINTQWEALDQAYRSLVGDEPEPEERKAVAK